MKGLRTTHGGSILSAFGATALVALVVGLGGGVRAGGDRPNRVAIGTINMGDATAPIQRVRLVASAVSSTPTTMPFSATTAATFIPSVTVTATTTPTLVSTATATPTGAATNMATSTASAANTATSTATSVSSATPTGTSTSAGATSAAVLPASTPTRTPTTSATATATFGGVTDSASNMTVTPTSVPHTTMTTMASATPISVPRGVPTASPNVLPGGYCGPCIGLYGDYTSLDVVSRAYLGNWGFPADVAARGTPGRPYTGLGVVKDGNGNYNGSQDQYVHDGIQAGQHGGNWLSFWTVSGPTGSDSWRAAGYAAGQFAASELEHINGGSHLVPTYVVVDEEGYNIDPQTQTAQQFADLAHGFADGVRSISSPDPLTPAFYAGESRYSSAKPLLSDLPAFIAETNYSTSNPVEGIQGLTPGVSGQNIQGYIAYYSQCYNGQGVADPGDDGSANKDVAQVGTWGATFSTLQFHYKGSGGNYEDPMGCRV